MCLGTCTRSASLFRQREFFHFSLEAAKALVDFESERIMYNIFSLLTLFRRKLVSGQHWLGT